MGERETGERLATDGCSVNREPSGGGGVGGAPQSAVPHQHARPSSHPIPLSAILRISFSCGDGGGGGGSLFLACEDFWGKAQRIILHVLLIVFIIFY